MRSIIIIIFITTALIIIIIIIVTSWLVRLMLRPTSDHPRPVLLRTSTVPVLLRIAEVGGGWWGLRVDVAYACLLMILLLVHQYWTPRKLATGFSTGPLGSAEC